MQSTPRTVCPRRCGELDGVNWESTELMHLKSHADHIEGVRLDNCQHTTRMPRENRIALSLGTRLAEVAPNGCIFRTFSWIFGWQMSLILQNHLGIIRSEEVRNGHWLRQKCAFRLLLFCELMGQTRLRGAMLILSRLECFLCDEKSSSPHCRLKAVFT